MRSNYIVIEGLEGAGKTTARQLVVETLQSAGIHDMALSLPKNCVAWCWISSPRVMRSLMIKRKC